MMTCQIAEETGSTSLAVYQAITRRQQHQG